MSNHWNTKNELEYIDMLGTYGEKQPGEKLIDRMEMCLRSYISTWSLRHDWGKIDKFRALTAAKDKLIKVVEIKGLANSAAR